MSRPKITGGANLICYINGTPWGAVMEFSWDDQEATAAIHGLDSLQAYELAPESSDTQFKMVIWKVVADGGIEGRGMATLPYQLSRQKYFTVLIRERTTDTVVFRADFCKVTNQNWNNIAQKLVQGTVNCRSIDRANETQG